MSDPDVTIFASDLVAIGRFRCPIDHPKFRNSGPIRQSCFVFPRSSVVIEHDGQPPFVGDPALATMYNAGQAYERRPVSAEGDRCDWYAVAPSVIGDAVQPFDPAAAEHPARAIRHLHAPVSPALYLAQRRLFLSLQSETPPEPLQVEETTIGLLTELLASAYRGAPRRSSSGERTRAARQRRDLALDARRMLDRTYRHPPGLRALAAAVGCSPFHLCRAFRDVTGSTIHGHLTTVRLRAALEALPDARDMTAVALDAGFSSHSHFTAAFRRSFGIPPSRAFRARF